MDPLVSGWVSKQLANVPYYRERNVHIFGNAPIVTKAAYRNNYNAFLSSCLSGPHRTEIISQAQLPSESSSVSTYSPYEVRTTNYFYERSSGTTGPPVWYPASKPERYLMALRSMENRRKFVPSFTPFDFIDLNQTFLGRNHRFSDDEITVFYEAFRPKRRTHLYGHLGLLLKHARLLSHQRKKKLVQTVEVAGEPLRAGDLDLLQDVFGGQVIGQLGTRETWAMGYSLSGNNVFELVPDVLVEVYSDDFTTVIQGKEEGHIVVTSLLRTTFPIIKFSTGDRGKITRNAKGRSFLELAADRENSLVLTTAGDRISGSLWCKRLMSNVKDDSGNPVSFDWKVRRAGMTINVYLHRRDARCRKSILRAFTDQEKLVGRLEVAFIEWEGWEDASKRIPFVDLSK